MYFGSVRFFKHVISTMVIIIILGLSISTLSLFLTNKSYQKQIAELESVAVLAKSQEEMDYIRQGESLDYQKLYPEMYATLPEKYNLEPKTVYLTFDDGPSDRTIEILDILKEKGIKATFFVIGKNGKTEKAMMKRIVEEGHTIGIHTYSHVYHDIYASVDNYLADFHKIYNLIYENTGQKAEIYRFPGGSINTYNNMIYQEIIAEMTRRGFTYYDWNASSGDTISKASKKSVFTRSIDSAKGKERVILLMHDGETKRNTVAALLDIIEHFEEKGFQFDRITNKVKPVSFCYED